MTDDEQLLDMIRRINGHLVIRAARADDGTDFERLMNRHYRRQKPAGYYGWQFADCPFPALLVVAIDADQMVACMGGHIRSLTDGRCVLFALDLLVDEQYRNRGLHRLLEAELERFASAHRAVALATLPNPSGEQAHLSVPGCRRLGAVATMARSAAQSPVTPGPARIPASPLLAFRRDEHYRRWRFGNNPEYRYHRLALGDGSFAVAKAFRDPAAGASMIDLVEYGTTAEALDAASLLAALADVPELRGLGDTITTWALPHAPSHAAFNALGFRPLERSRTFCVRPFADGHDDLLDFARWDLVEADSEIF